MSEQLDTWLINVITRYRNDVIAVVAIYLQCKYQPKIRGSAAISLEDLYAFGEIHASALVISVVREQWSVSGHTTQSNICRQEQTKSQ